MAADTTTHFPPLSHPGHEMLSERPLPRQFDYGAVKCCVSTDLTIAVASNNQQFRLSPLLDNMAE